MCLIVLVEFYTHAKWNKHPNPEADLKWLNIKLDYVGEPSLRALGHHQLRVKVYSDIIEALRLQSTASNVLLAPEQLLDPLAERPHKVLSQQAEMRVEVEFGVCVAL